MHFPKTMEELPQDVERRHSQRIRFDQPAQFQLKVTSTWEGCVSRDISGGGLQVYCNGFVPLRTALVLRIQLAAEEIVECMARVVWASKLPWMDRYRLGLEFEPGDSFVKIRDKIFRVIQSSSGSKETGHYGG